MSHFVVLVTRTDEETLEEQLEPFYEQGEEGDYFMKKEYFLKRDEKAVDAWIASEIEKYAGFIKDGDRPSDDKKWYKKEIDELERIAKRKTLDRKLKAIQQHEGGELDEEGLYWLNNPNAKWDWWVEGGRLEK